MARKSFSPVLRRAGFHGLLLLALTVPSLASAASSGRYGSLAIAVVKDRVHGVFAEGRAGNGTPEQPQFSCLFLFEGHVDRAQARIVTWYPGEPERIAGTLRLGKEASLQLDENHGGCLMATGDMKNAAFVLSMDTPRSDWIGAGLVTAKRAVLHREPDARSTQTRPYLVELDAIAILEQRPGWVRAEFLGSERPVVGWLRQSEVAVSLTASE